MRIHSVVAENFMLFRKFKKVFGDKEVVGIVAEYKDNPKRSNKGGKSTVGEMIYYVLTGDSRAKRDVELIHHGEDVMKVTLTLVDDEGNKTKITRGRDIKNNGVIEINGVERTKEAQGLIDEIIGYNKKELPLTCFLKQMEIEGFMSLGPAVMKQHLMNWLKNNHWLSLEIAANEDLNTAKKKREKIVTQIELLRSQLKDMGKVSDMKIELAESEEKLVEVNGKISKLEKKISKSKEKRRTYDSDFGRLEDSIIEARRDLDEQLDEYEGLFDDAQDLGKYKKYKNVDIDKTSDLRAAAYSTCSDLEDLVESMENEFTGKCPILNKSCDRIKYSKKEVKKTKGTISDLQEKMDIMAVKMNGAARWQEANEADIKSKKIKKKLDPLTAKLKKLNKEMEKLQEDAEKFQDTSKLRSQLKELKNVQNDTSEDVGSLKGTIATAKNTKSQIKDLGSKIIKLDQKIGDLRYVSNMFGKNGIPSLEIENAFDEVEDEMNFILDRLKTGLQVEFKPTREIDKWEDYCVSCGWQFPKGTRTKLCEDCGVDRRKKKKDELHLRVVEGDEDSGFHMESGGGKTMVALSVRLGLTRLKQRQTGSQFKVLFLDEPDAALDPVNKSAFVKLITETLISEFGFEQVFWISHDRDIQESIPNVLKITKYGTYSKAAWL